MLVWFGHRLRKAEGNTVADTAVQRCGLWSVKAPSAAAPGWRQAIRSHWLPLGLIDSFLEAELSVAQCNKDVLVRNKDRWFQAVGRGDVPFRFRASNGRNPGKLCQRAVALGDPRRDVP